MRNVYWDGQAMDSGQSFRVSSGDSAGSTLTKISACSSGKFPQNVIWCPDAYFYCLNLKKYKVIHYKFNNIKVFKALIFNQLDQNRNINCFDLIFSVNSFVNSVYHFCLANPLNVFKFRSFPIMTLHFSSGLTINTSFLILNIKIYIKVDSNDQLKVSSCELNWPQTTTK
jgi:hypothetical protein